MICSRHRNVGAKDFSPVQEVRTGRGEKYFARTLIVIKFFYGQATKGVRWMPRQREAMKDVVSCEKLRGAANRL